MELTKLRPERRERETEWGFRCLIINPERKNALNGLTDRGGMRQRGKRW